MRDLYEPISKHYDRLSSVYSLGRIPRCRKAFVAEICKAIRGAGTKEVRVCLVGAGHGAEAIAMAEGGAYVTVVDQSESMLDMFREKLSHVSDETMTRVNIIHDDARNIEHRYDWVVANFFLNVFSEPQMEEMLDVLLSLVEKRFSGGKLIIGDFYQNRDGNGVVRFLQKLNWYMALCIFNLFVKNAKHPICDYGEYLSGRGWKREKVEKFGLLGVSFYRASLYSKADDLD